MAPTADEDLLPWTREVRGVDQLEADPAVLDEIRTFFYRTEAESARLATHVVLENFPDWWAKNRRAPPGLEIEKQEDVEELYRHAGTLYDLGIPLTLGERRTAAFRLFQDLEAWGTRENCLSIEDLIGPDTSLTLLIGTVIGEVFPGHGGFLDMAVYDSTGMSQTKGVKKTSLRLVWPGIVVDSDRAARLRDLLVHRLASAAAEGGPIGELEVKMRELSQVNAWHSFVGDAAYAVRSSVRMPLSDRVSPLPLRAPEGRPLAPVGVLRFSFCDKVKVEWLCRKEELDSAEWIKIGSLRQGVDTPLTEWTVPSWPGNQPIPPSSTRTGRVKVRTAGGSDGGGGLRLRAARPNLAPERAGQLLTVERRLPGTPEEFCEKMDAHLGKASVDPDGSFVWRQPGSDSRIIMYAEDSRVKVIGRPNQVRSLVVIVAPFTEALPGLSSARPGGPAPLPDGRAPSAAFAPLEPEAPRRPAEAQADAEAGRQMRVVAQAFESQGQSELALAEGEAVCVTHDPEGEQGNEDRWVYGCNEATGQRGWFPLSHTAEPDGGAPRQPLPGEAEDQANN